MAAPAMMPSTNCSTPNGTWRTGSPSHNGLVFTTGCFYIGEKKIMKKLKLVTINIANPPIGLWDFADWVQGQKELIPNAVQDTVTIAFNVISDETHVRISYNRMETDREEWERKEQERQDQQEQAPEMGPLVYRVLTFPTPSHGRVRELVEKFGGKILSTESFPVERKTDPDVTRFLISMTARSYVSCTLELGIREIAAAAYHYREHYSISNPCLP